MPTLVPPTNDEVVELMNMLFGLDIDCSKPSDVEVYSIAEYVNEAGEPMGFLACDHAGSCRLGAALTQIPTGYVEDSIKEADLPDNLAENLYEVFNVAVNLLQEKIGSRIALGRTAHGSSGEHYEELKQLIADRETSNYKFSIARYGECCIQVGM